MGHGLQLVRASQCRLSDCPCHLLGITLNRRTGSSTSCATGASASLHYADVPRAIYNISRPHRLPKNYYIRLCTVLRCFRPTPFQFIRAYYMRVYACIYTSSCKSRWCTGPKRWGGEKEYKAPDIQPVTA